MLGLAACSGDDPTENGGSSDGISSSGGGSPISGTVSIQPVPPAAVYEPGVRLIAVYSGDIHESLLRYQWEIDGADIPGAQADSIITSREGDYFVKVSAVGYSGLVGPNASTRVIGSASLGLSGTAGITVRGGGAAEVGCVLEAAYEGSAVGALSYKWFVNVGIAPAGTESTITAAEAGTYFVLISAVDCVGIVRSSGFVVTIPGEAPPPQKILAIPLPTSAGIGSFFSFTSELYSGSQRFTLRRGAAAVAITAATSPALYSAGGWANPSEGNYWEISTFAGTFSDLVCDVNLTGTAAGPGQFKIQYSYNGAFADIPSGAVLTMGPSGVDNADNKFMGKAIPGGAGTLMIRIVQDGNSGYGQAAVGAGDGGFKTFELRGLYTAL
jgi:hypothetical protein